MGKLTKGVLLVGGAAVALGAGAYLYYKKQVEKLTSKEFEDLEKEDEQSAGLYFDSLSDCDFRSHLDEDSEGETDAFESFLKSDSDNHDDLFEDEDFGADDFIDDDDFEDEEDVEDFDLSDETDCPDIKELGLECVSSTKDLIGKVGSLLSNLANSKTMSDEEKQAYCKGAVAEIKEAAKKSGNAYTTYTLNKTADILDGFEAFLDMSKEAVDKKAKEFADKSKANSKNNSSSKNDNE